MNKKNLIVIFLILFGICFYYYFKKEPIANAPITEIPPSTLLASENPDPIQQIISFNLNSFYPPIIGEIDNVSKTINLTVPQGTDPRYLIPTIKLKTGYTINPISQSGQNFSNPVIYTIKDQNSSTTIYKVTVSIATSTNYSQVINIKDQTFGPSTITIKSGTKVTWLNNDNVPHLIKSDSEIELVSNVIYPGEYFSYIFKKPSLVNYYCYLHPGMKGSIKVEK